MLPNGALPLDTQDFRVNHVEKTLWPFDVKACRCLSLYVRIAKPWSALKPAQ